ncbi:hypothetical protein L4Z64_000939 [Pseudomonas aeruginosa]|jgi:hypothetical protein|uniref:hypothetical protein n=1 Tax=Pseudomonas aeruginosa TaxID=287 RepID=UPI00117B2A09|nr:hypothetical protein [Pseudomonas aeruginosa]EKV0425436.1 hypothetical protein [Pseudomonas aeruginosa]EKX0638094.1 hypothetical protein [Pseudomonas aeruginosa]MBA4900086.1 hypothetical protein [Pseudomonas aeruginosa]MBG4849750.1 hypothetical protein [Pseudomonas aeruginosa]MBH9297931.1 hypothetical protein [Pseudomonas aeruginosa]
MNVEISDWIALAALATSLFTYLESKKEHRTGEAISALTEVINASERTQTYLQARAGGMERNRETEWDLAECWSRAAFLISRVNKELSVRLDGKSRFWRDPETWSIDLRAHKDISLEKVAIDARKLMNSYA